MKFHFTYFWGRGEMISQVPQRVHVKNKKICTASVLSGAGRRKLIQTSFLAFFRHGRTIKKKCNM